MLGTKLRVRRKTWPVVSSALALAAIAWPTLGCRRKNPIASPPPVATKEQSPPDAQRLIDPTFLIQIWTETTPPGARIVRVSDGHPHGWTPEIVEVPQSDKPVSLRLELDGYVPVTREVSALWDGELKVVLQPIPKGRDSATKKSKGRKGR
jgi:PEGA domain